MNYQKKTVRDIDVKGKKVLLRCDFNVPQDKKTGAITSDKRIVAALPTIRYLLDQGAAVIACSHLGKPQPDFDKWVKKQTEKGKDPATLTEDVWSKEQKKLTLAPVAARLAELLGQEVIFASDVVGEDAQAKAAALQPGQVLLLENTRFEKGETKNDPAFAQKLASMAEVYVSDAFGAVHRAHASTAGVAKYLPAVSGFLIEKELRIIGGGAKSKLWKQILADVCNVTLHDVSTFSDSATSLGAAAAAGVAIGLFGNLPEACSHIRMSGDIEPDLAVQEAYALTKKRYAMLYPSLKEAFHTRA